MRVGLGFDIHRFSKDRPLILGGVNIPAIYGLTGHSDADVLLHSVADAILGAAGLGDIGELFPDTDLTYKDIRSTILLEKIYMLIKDKWFIENIDSVIVCEEPRIQPFKDAMKDNISKILKLDKSGINIKATTTEGLGALGRSEGICAYAVALLKERL